jgi:hypothetical protein
MGATLVNPVRGILAIGNSDLSMNRGFVSVDNPSTGVYVFTLEDQVDVTSDVVCLVKCCQVAGSTGAAEYNSATVSQSPTQYDDSQIQVSLFNTSQAAVAADFTIQIQDVAPN